MSVPVVAVKSSKSAMERPVKADLQSIKQRFIFNLRRHDNPRRNTVFH